MSIAASIPVADRVAANTVLEKLGYGPNNFSVPIYTDGPVPTHVGLHASSEGQFAEDVKALPNVVWSEEFGEPMSRMELALESVSGKIRNNAKELRGAVSPGLHMFDGELWWVDRGYDAGKQPNPELLPEQARRAQKVVGL